MLVVWSALAVEDLKQVRSQQGEVPAQLRETIVSLQHRVQSLKYQSLSGRKGRIFGTREMAVEGTPYLLVYRIQRDRLEILRVLSDNN
jgi:toxin ParE1/3/4